jgi:CheY-like chemotaxis protein
MSSILIVEDNEMNRDMLARRLRRRGYRVMFALDGEQAIQVAYREQPDLILMDMSLPGVDGWQATAHLKADVATAHIPVIALTAHVMSGDRDRALEAGCDEYEPKPVDLDRLLGKMGDLLRTDGRG